MTQSRYVEKLLQTNISDTINIKCEIEVRMTSINGTINVWDKTVVLTDTIND
jgi:hypothetical protein